MTRKQKFGRIFLSEASFKTDEGSTILSAFQVQVLKWTGDSGLNSEWDLLR
jgi:hypothetical protein